ncbi:hypothetical protein ES703_16202 [subsurface metagenome]
MFNRIRYPRWLHETLMLFVVPLWHIFVYTLWAYLIYEFSGPKYPFP